MSFSLCLEPSYGTHGFSDAWFGAIPRLCLGTGCPAGRIVPGMVQYSTARYRDADAD